LQEAWFAAGLGLIIRPGPENIRVISTGFPYQFKIMASVPGA
jgi:hypothetical protein